MKRYNRPTDARKELLKIIVPYFWAVVLIGAVVVALLQLLGIISLPY
jgi:hypothetical protein